MKTRQKNLLKHANKSGYNAIVALDPENLFYMTGFWGEAIGVLDSSGAKIIPDWRYADSDLPQGVLFR